MFTRCGHCNTVFSITAEQLRAGRGRGRCGACLREFDALEWLSENLSGAAPLPLAPRAEAPPRTAKPEPLAETDGADADAPEALAEEWSVGRPAPPLPAPASASPALPVLERPPVIEPSGEEEVPEVLREDLARVQTARRGRRRTVLWSIASAVLVVALAGQYAWFMPGDLLARYPQARDLVTALCARTGCTLPETREPDLIRIVARDVRIHPRYEGALLVTATMVNAAPAPQPLPLLEFTLFNVSGRVIASRVFTPKQYLHGAEVPSEMLPQQPVQIGLEMIAPEQAAVSFEFRFL